MKNTTAIILLFFAAFAFYSCNKISDTEGTVDLYLLESYETLDYSCGINEATALTKDKPLIKYSDFQSYDPINHAFKLSHKAENIIKDTNNFVFGAAFGIKANNELIYTGYFWPSLSSASCVWIVIDPLMIANDRKLYVKLGYPSKFKDTQIIDKRNDERIINIFKRDHKLD